MSILALFILLQVADGLFTYVGVQRWGLGAEGNPWIITLMTHLGVIPALLLAKAISIASGVFLQSRNCVRSLMWLTWFYVVVVVGPWALLFLGVL